MYAAEAWDPKRKRWVRMDSKTGHRRWRPGQDLDRLIASCLEHTQGSGVPALQIVDEGGAPVWRDNRSGLYPKAGASIYRRSHALDEQTVEGLW